MRIIAGSAKGTRLATVPGGTRPLSDRAREGLFSSLGPTVVGATFLDLFAGTGAVGIEALSRGASGATFVDAAPAAIAAIRENVRRARVADRARVIRADARRALPRLARRFEVLFLDPPYGVPGSELDGLLAALDGSVAGDGALVVLTRSAQSYMPVIPVHWAADRRLSYGDAIILAFRT